MKEHDVIIIGGGPAGLSCALECKDSNLSHVVLERARLTGGQLHEIKSPIPNLATRAPENGSELAAMMEASIKNAQCNIQVSSPVKAVDFKNLTVQTDDAIYRGKAIFIATGARFRKPDFRNLEKFGDYVFYKTGVDIKIFEDREVVVAGGGDSALFTAIDLKEVARKITLVHRRSQFRGRLDLVAEVKASKNIDVITESQITTLEGESHLRFIEVTNNKSNESSKIKADYVYAKLGYIPNSELFKNMLNLTESGHIVVDKNLATEIPGVFAGGDVTAMEYDRIAISMGHGCLAAGSILKYLESSSIDLIPDMNLLSK